MNNKKTLYILRGCPGSGKSTWAKEFQQKHIMHPPTEDYMNVIIISADDYFIRPDGVYEWSANTISNAHRWCRERAGFHMSGMMFGGAVIIDNTNIKRKDFKVYVEMAEYYGFEVVEKVFGEFTEEAIQLYAQRNTHKVPIETIRKMANTLKESLKNNE